MNINIIDLGNGCIEILGIKYYSEEQFKIANQNSYQRGFDTAKENNYFYAKDISEAKEIKE